MNSLWWRLFGKRAINFWIQGKQELGYSDEEIIELLEKSPMRFTKDQIKYAKRKLITQQGGEETDE